MEYAPGAIIALLVVISLLWGHIKKDNKPTKQRLPIKPPTPQQQGGLTPPTTPPVNPATFGWYERWWNYCEKFPDEHPHIWTTAKAIGNALKRGSFYIISWVLALIVLKQLLPDAWEWYWGHHAIFWSTAIFLVVTAMYRTTIFGKDNLGAKIAWVTILILLLLGIGKTVNVENHFLNELKAQATSAEVQTTEAAKSDSQAKQDADSSVREKSEHEKDGDINIPGATLVLKTLLFLVKYFIPIMIGLSAFWAFSHILGGSAGGKQLSDIIKLGMKSMVWLLVGLFLIICCWESCSPRSKFSFQNQKSPIIGRHVILPPIQVSSDDITPGPEFDPWIEKFTWTKPRDDKPLLVIDVNGNHYIDYSDGQTYLLYMGDGIPDEREWKKIGDYYGKRVKSLTEFYPKNITARHYFQFRALIPGDVVEITPIISRRN